MVRLSEPATFWASPDLQLVQVLLFCRRHARHHLFNISESAKGREELYVLSVEGSFISFKGTFCTSAAFVPKQPLTGNPPVCRNVEKVTQSQARGGCRDQTHHPNMKRMKGPKTFPKRQIPKN